MKKSISKNSWFVLLAVVLLSASLFFGTVADLQIGVYAQEEASTVHTYRHSEKYRFNEKGDAINATVFADTDEETYPFLYEYRTTEGEAWGQPGSQKNQAVLMTGVKSEPWAKGAIYGDSTFTGFNSSGGIGGIDGDIAPRELILSFVSPFDGAVSAEFTLDYNINYPSKANNYNVYGNQYDATFDGFQYKVTLNGYQVYPQTGWNQDIAKKHTAETAAGTEYAVGDLIRVQDKQTIPAIYAEKGDKVSLVLSKVNSMGVPRCDDSYFDAVFSVDTSVQKDGYKKIVGTLDTFDAMSENSANNVLSYYSYDCSEGYYAKAEAQLMEQVDYATSAFCSALFGDAAKITFNAVMPTVKRDAAIVYKADRTGNLTIISGNTYRGGDLAIWQYFDMLAIEDMEGLKDADGFRMRIEKNGSRVWPTDSPWMEYKPDTTNKGVFDFADFTLGVQEGDTIAIRFNCGEAENTSLDSINFSPMFLLAETDNPMEDAAVTPDPDEGGDGDKEPGGDTDKEPGNEDETKGGCGGSVAGGVSLSIAGSLMLAALALVRKSKKSV